MSDSEAVAATRPCLDELTTELWLTRRLSPSQVADIEAHLAVCADCFALLAAVAETCVSSPAAVDPTMATDGAAAPLLPEQLAPGARIGRYVISRLVGMGEMGVIHAAYDPELDRKLAIKLLRPDRAADAGRDARRARLVREASALARLKHPNVVAIYDVGMVDDRLYLAIELVEGQTATAWLGRKPSRDRVLAMFLAAGRGLAAAHAAGIVHRDFKPDNVIVTAADHVVVTDFGLAVAGDSDDVASELGRGNVAASVDLTATGMVVGTPAYLAPEVFRGVRADARSDQFSFCVALYEALTGRRPFAGRTLAELRDAVATGQVAPLPDGSVRPPRRIMDVLARGLALDPAARFSSMTQLLNALEATSQTRRRLVAALVGVAVVLTAGVWWSSSRPPAAVCAGAERRLEGVWDPTIRDAMSRAFAATGRPDAAATFARVAAQLDQYATSWVSERREACETTRVRGEQSVALLDVRIACSEDALMKLDALTAVLAVADSGVVDRSIAAIGELPAPTRCRGAVALARRDIIAPPPEHAAELDELRRDVARMVALRTAGKYVDALQIAAPTLARAERIGWTPLIGEVLMNQGYLQLFFADVRAAEPTFRAAIAAADRGRDDFLRVRAFLGLLFGVAYLDGEYARAEEFAAAARAALERGGGDELLESGLHTYLGLIRMAEGRLEEAERETAAGLEVRRARVPDSWLVVASLANLGQVRGRRGDHVGALAAFEDALQAAHRGLGDGHPFVVDIQLGMGEVALRQRRFRDAETTFRSALERIREPGTSWSHQEGLAQLGLATALRGRGALVEALAAATTGVADLTAVFSSSHANLVPALVEQATIELALGHRDQARATLERAVTLGRAEDPIAQPHAQLGLAQLLATSDPARARSLAREARQTLARVEGWRSDELRELEQSVSAR